MHIDPGKLACYTLTTCLMRCECVSMHTCSMLPGTFGKRIYMRAV